MQEVDMRNYKPPKTYRLAQFTLTIAVGEGDTLPHARGIVNHLQDNIPGTKFVRAVPTRMTSGLDAADVREAAGLVPDAVVYDKLK